MSLTPRTVATASLAAASLACLLLCGCHVTTDNHGDKSNVDISTPFGNMKVKADNSTDTTAIGLTAYPGAVPDKDNDDSGHNNANVNMSFGSFHLGVQAAGFQTTDSQDKVLAFYRKDLATRYGSFIECRGHDSVGTPTRTSDGLTCADSANSQVDTDDNGHKGFAITSGDSTTSLQLRSGSTTHQHIVAVDSKDGGTKIGLVALDLPSHLTTHSSKDSE